MAQTTTNYGLLKPESTDSYNHMIYDNPNMDTIDAAMKANADAAVTTASCIKSGTVHTITRSNTGANMFKFTATGDWNTGDTMIVDGVTVTPYLSTGEALLDGAFIINTEVLACISGTRVTVYTNQSTIPNATQIEYAPGVSVKQQIDANNAFTSNTAGTGVTEYHSTSGLSIIYFAGAAITNGDTLSLLTTPAGSFQGIVYDADSNAPVRIAISAAKVITVRNMAGTTVANSTLTGEIVIC